MRFIIRKKRKRMKRMKREMTKKKKKMKKKKKKKEGGEEALIIGAQKKAKKPVKINVLAKMTQKPEARKCWSLRCGPRTLRVFKIRHDRCLCGAELGTR